ncbi:MAG: radical SAM protein [Anaerolineae bacterium]|nr:radical SAM protein [Anaerolineae bacterium]
MCEERSLMQIQSQAARSILSKASGFISDFDFTLNPYSGCAFACTYCYAAFFTPTQALQDSWGQWVHVKDNALELLQRRRKRPLVDKTIYMSSVTDPYQPVEKKLGLTRAILRELLDYHRVHLVIQTRSPLVCRDLDLIRAFPSARVNMTVTTDDETIRKAFEPTCPPNAQRLNAIRDVAAAGIDACVTLAPLLPVRDAEAFAQMLVATGVRKFAIQHFHAARSRFVAGTGPRALALLTERRWNARHYALVKLLLAARLPDLREGRAGFAPVW